MNAEYFQLSVYTKTKMKTNISVRATEENVLCPDDDTEMTQPTHLGRLGGGGVNSLNARDSKDII